MDREDQQERKNYTSSANPSIKQMTRSVLGSPPKVMEIPKTQEVLANDILAQSVKEIYLANPGITTKNIAQQLQISDSLVYRLLKKLHLKPNSPTRLRAQSVKEIYLANPGISKANIARQLHISISYVYQLLKQLGVTPTRDFIERSVKEIYLANPGITTENISKQLQISSTMVYISLSRLHLRANRPENFTLLPTAQAVVSMRNKSACATLQDIADNLGISRQRVHQILKKEDLRTKHYTQKTRFECQVCGKTSSHKFCSVECKKKWHEIPVTCTTCGKLFTRSRRQLLAHYKEFLFCSRECFGKWTGERHGFKAHPENGVRGKKPKWDYSLVWKTHLETGYGAVRLSRLLNIPERTITMILEKCRNQETN